MSTNRILKVGAAVIALAFAGQASAVAIDGPWACDDVAFTVGGSDFDFDACEGSVKPPPNDSLSSVNDLLGTSFTSRYKDDNEGMGSDTSLFDGVGLSNTTGYITFNASFDTFALVLKLGQGWSVYLFEDGITAGTRLDYSYFGDFTLGTGLSHVSIYGTPTQVPEPTSLALLGLGLLGLGLARRRG